MSFSFLTACQTYLFVCPHVLVKWNSFWGFIQVSDITLFKLWFSQAISNLSPYHSLLLYQSSHLQSLVAEVKNLSSYRDRIVTDKSKWWLIFLSLAVSSPWLGTTILCSIVMHIKCAAGEMHICKWESISSCHLWRQKICHRTGMIYYWGDPSTLSSQRAWIEEFVALMLLCGFMSSGKWSFQSLCFL